MKFEIEHIENSWQDMLGYLQGRIVQENRNIVLLKGDLGSGKTTLVKQYVKSLGGDDYQVDSPTFSIVNTYKLDGHEVHHFDLYRLNSAEEIDDIGFMEYVESGNLCFVEWPQKIAEFLPSDKTIDINIVVSLSKCREYTFS